MILSYKKLFSILLLLVVIMFGASCGKDSIQKEPSTFPNTKTNPSIVVELLGVKSSLGKKYLSLRITNNSANIIHYGEAFQLLFYNGNDWTEENYVSDSTTTLAHYLNSGENREVTFELTSKYFLDESKLYFFTIKIEECVAPREYASFTYGLLLDEE